MRMHHPKKQIEMPVTSIMDKTKEEGFIIKTLGFDSAQKMKLDNLMEAHQKFLDKYMGAYTIMQTNIFNVLKNNGDSVKSMSTSVCADSIGKLKSAMENELFNHFSSLKSICTKEQLPKFNELIDNMSNDFVQRHGTHNSLKTKPDSL